MKSNVKIIQDIARTEGIKYAGSKRRIIPYILDVIDDLPVKCVMDGFAGTTRVSQSLARSGYDVVCNDTAAYSAVFGRCYLLNKQDENHYRSMLDHLNNLKDVDGWYTKNYGGHANNGSSIQSDGFKRPWQIQNTRKLDAIRPEIDCIASNEVERSVLLTSLMIALDRVDNTVGHHASYLREWAPRSYKTMKMKMPACVFGDGDHEVHTSDIFDLISAVDCDLAYFDPPYGSANEKMPPSRVRYAAYYHLWKTICINDRPKITGAARRREDAGDLCMPSVFENYRRSDDGKYQVIYSIERLIQATSAPYILLSYSNHGRVTREELLEMLGCVSSCVTVHEIDHKKHVMASMNWTNEWSSQSKKENREMLILVKK
jgi:adenine-specific DNA-methyltransferase